MLVIVVNCCAKPFSLRIQSFIKLDSFLDLLYLLGFSGGSAGNFAILGKKGANICETKDSCGD